MAIVAGIRIVRSKLEDKLECQEQNEQHSCSNLIFVFHFNSGGNVLIGWNTHIAGAVLLLIPNIEFPNFEMN